MRKNISMITAAVIMLFAAASCSSVKLEKQFISFGSAVISFSEDSSLLAEINLSGLNVWEVSSGTLLFSQYGNGNIWLIGTAASIIFSKDKSQMAVLMRANYSKEGKVVVLDIKNRKLNRVIEDKEREIFSIRFASDGAIKAVCSDKNRIVLRDLDAKKNLFVFPQKVYESIIDNGPFGGMGVIFEYQSSVRFKKNYDVWDVDAEKIIYSDVDRSAYSEQLVLSSDLSLRTYCTMNITQPDDFYVVHYKKNAAHINILSSKKFHPMQVTSVSISPDSRYVAAVENKSILHIYNTDSAKELVRVEIESQSVESPVISPDNTYAAVSTEHGILILNVARKL